jgi:hypothetical protein
MKEDISFRRVSQKQLGRWCGQEKFFIILEDCLKSDPPPHPIQPADTILNPKPCCHINLRCRVAKSHIWLLRWPIGEREVLCHAPAAVGAPDLHLERARDRVGGSRTAWCANYWWGECPVRRGGRGGLRGQIKPSKQPEIHENGEKRAVSRNHQKRRFSLKST